MSNRIAEFRKRKGWTQEQLAEAVGLASRSLVSDLEHERRNVEWLARLRRIAKALGCRPYELVMEPEDIPPEVVGKSHNPAFTDPLDAIEWRTH